MKQTFLLTALLVALTSFAQTITTPTSHQWKGKWITRTEDKASTPAPYFRNVFTLTKPVRQATAYVCGVGYHETFINGKRVTSNVLEQSFTRYDRRLLYTHYDVTRLVSKGANCIGAELGNGWYNMQTKTIWNFNSIGWRKSPRLLFDLVIEYKDGSRDTIASDRNWKTMEGPSRYNGLYTGEIYDARNEIRDWNKASFNDQAWAQAMETVSPGGILLPMQMPGVQIIRRIKPVSMKRLNDTTWLYDMGQNFAGVTSLQVKGKAGDSIHLFHEETLDSSGRVDRRRNSSQMIDAPPDPFFQTDIYVLKGSGKEIFTPRFTYHGFQYVEVRAPSHITLDLTSLEGLFYSTGFETAGYFESSDPLLNQLYQAAIQSYRSNFISAPTDCPTREKMGWLGDAQLLSESGLYTFNSGSSYQKWLGDIRDVQLESGLLPGVAPTEGRGYQWIDPADPDMGPGWGSAIVTVPWAVYVHTRDTNVLRENYAAGKKYMDYLLTKLVGDLYVTGLPDWLAIDLTPKAITSTGHVYGALLLLQKMAKIVGTAEDAARYGAVASRMRVAFNKAFLEPGKVAYKDVTLTSIAVPLHQRLCPDSMRTVIASQLLRTVQLKKFRMDAGIVGAKYVLKALSDAGYIDAAYQLLTNKAFPGWGYFIEQGSKTLWEDWEGVASRNHPSFGTYNGWLFSTLVGIQPDEAAPGFQHFYLRPQFPKGLDWIKAKHMTRYGAIEVEWKKQGSEVVIVVVVPKGTSADLELLGLAMKLGAGRHVVRYTVR